MTEMLWLPAASDRFTPGRTVAVDTLILHTTVGTWDGTIATFTGGSRRVSAHYVIDQTRDRIAKCVQEWDTAWHAGNWPINQRSIGIEHVDDGDYWDPRPEDQYDRSVALIIDICRRWPIQIGYVLRHEAVTATACPAGLDTDRIIREVSLVDYTPELAEKVKQEVRNVVLGEPGLVAAALRKFLAAPYMAERKVRRAKKAEVQKGHGRGSVGRRSK